MTCKHIANALLASAGALALTACGGGGGGPRAEVIPLAPTTPTPPATPPPPPIAPAHLGLVSAQPFAVVAMGDSYTTNAEGVGTPVDGPSVKDVQFSYNPAANSYQISVPGFQTGTLANTGYSGISGQPASSSFSQVTVGSSSTLQPLFVTLPVPGTSHNPYTYTSFGSWDGQDGTTATGAIIHEEGNFAYGIPTLAGGVPTSGSANYSAEVRGSIGPNFYVGGSATLQFDFAGGALSGHFDPVVYDWDMPVSLGRYDFASTIYASGSTTFSGGLSQAGVGTGAFAGQFTGPTAEELMARWSVPVLNPLSGPMGGEPGTASGVWVGTKH